MESREGERKVALLLLLLLYSCVSETVGFVSVLGKAGSICAEAGKIYRGKRIPCLRFFLIK